MLQISLIDPFMGGSHRQWAQGFQSASTHQVRLFGLPARHWKWRMYGGALTLADQLRDEPPPELLLVTDMCDLATLRARLGLAFSAIPVALYFHENQLTYPWSPTDGDPELGRDRHYAWKNFTSALVADRVFFNSNYHQASFLTALPNFLRAFPDFRPINAVEEISQKASVLPLGLDLASMQPHLPETRTPGPIRLLWNHRWEYDKQPEVFFDLCYHLKASGYAFQIIVLGKAAAKVPPCFAEARERLAAHIYHWGKAESRMAYAKLLGQADVLPVTSIQDFFGASVVEAMYAGVYPLLPNRLAYPEHLPDPLKPVHLYQTKQELFHKVESFLKGVSQVVRKDLQNVVWHYDWQQQGPIYDQKLLEVFSDRFK